MTTDDPARRRNGLTYAEAGVSIEAGAELVDRIKPAAAATARPGVMGALGGFGALFDLKAAGWEDPVLVAATDGVGTKLKVGIEADRLEGLGVDLVAMCVNDLVCQGAEPLFFLDYFATSALDPAHAARVVSGIADGCRQAGAALVGGETAEMPGLYAKGDFDLAGFAVGAAARDGLLPRPSVPGDAVIGLSSSGAHSNGFSLIRRVVESAGAAWDAPAPFDASKTLAEAFLTPTRIYVRTALELLRDPEIGPGVRGFAHITGGGLPENLPRILTRHHFALVSLEELQPQPEFAWLAQAGGVSEAEMFGTFNCGIGLAIVCAHECADALIQKAAELGEEARAIGIVSSWEQDPLADMQARVVVRDRLFGGDAE